MTNQPRDAADRRQSPQRDDERGKPHIGHEQSVDEAEPKPQGHGGGNSEHAEVGPQRRKHRDHGGRREDGADRQVDAARQDHESHARPKHDVDRGLLQDDREVGVRHEARIDPPEHQRDQHEGRQHAERRHQFARVQA